MWNQWPVTAVPGAPPPQPTVPPPLPDAPPPPPPADHVQGTACMPTAGVATAAVAGSAYMGANTAQSASNPYEQYTAAQYAAMTPEQQFALQQHWQQWQTYQQEYAKWHAQYGEQYKREMAAAAAATPATPNSVPTVTTASAPVAAAAVPIVYPPAHAMPQAQAYYPQQQLAQTPLQAQTQAQLPGKIMAQPQMYNQPPPPPPQCYQQHPQQLNRHQQPPPVNQWQQQPPPPPQGRFNQMPPTSFNQPPNSADSRMFPNLQQPPPSFMQQPPPSDAAWSKGPSNKGNDRSNNNNEADQRGRWDGPPSDFAQQQQRNNRWQSNDQDDSNNNNKAPNKPNQFGSRRPWHNNPSGNNNNNNRNNPFSGGPPGPYGADSDRPPQTGSGNFGVDAGGSGACNSGNFGGGGNYSGNFGNSGQGSREPPDDNFTGGNFDNNRRSGNNNNHGRWEQNRLNQSGGNFGPLHSNNKNNNSFNRGTNQHNFNHQQNQQQRAPDLDEASFDKLFDQWEKQFEDWKRANANHPDRDEYRRYEEEFEKQRRRIAERREQMRRRRQQQQQQQQDPQAPQQQKQQQRVGSGGSRFDDYEDVGASPYGPQSRNSDSKLRISSQELDEKRAADKSSNSIGEDEEQPHFYDVPENKQHQQVPGKLITPTPIANQSIFQQKPTQNLDQDVGTANLGKRKSDAGGTREGCTKMGTTSTPAKQTKQENILIISLDDDDDEVDELPAQQAGSQVKGSVVDTSMKNIFKKTDGIPGLDLVADGVAAGTGVAKQLDADKKIPSLFDVVIAKPPKTLQVDDISESEKEKATAIAEPTPAKTASETLSDDVNNALKDPDFMNNLSQALAQAQGREREQQKVQQEQQQKQQQRDTNDSKDGRPLSFAEWQRKKNNQASSSQDVLPDADKASEGNYGLGSGPGPAGNDPGNRRGFGPAGGGEFGPDQRPTHGFGPNGPPFGPGPAGGNQAMGPNFMDFGGQSVGNFGPNGPPPNFGGPNFGLQGPGSAQYGGGGTGANGPFGRNFGPGGPNNPNFYGPGPNFNERRPNFGPNFRGPGPNPFRPNFFGPNGPGPGPNFGGPGPFGGPNAHGPFDRNFGPGPGPNNPHFNGPNMGNNNNNNSFSDNPFRRNGGPPPPNFVDGPRDGPGGFEPRGKGQSRNSFGNAGNTNNDNNKPWPDGGQSFPDGSDAKANAPNKSNRNMKQQRGPSAEPASSIGNSPHSNEPVYRPIQVFDYQNSRNTAAKVIDYGHKSADNATANRSIGIAGPDSVPGPGSGPGSGSGPSPGAGPSPSPGQLSAIPEFRPVNTFDYGHASHNAPLSAPGVGGGAGPLNRNANINSNNKKKNKKKNKNRQRLLQQQQHEQQSSMLAGNEGADVATDNSKTDDLEDISDSEDTLADVARFESPPPPPKINKPQQQPHKAFPANPQRRMLVEPPVALFPSTASANNQIPDQSDGRRLEMFIPTNENRNTISIDEVLLPPGRLSRPKRLCIILRGPPGSGKSYVARLIKEKELEMGGANPRILSIDDYFIIENDYEEKCPKTGKKIPKKEILYEYDEAMEETYMQYLIKSFKKTLSDNLYDFVIVDCDNNSLRTLNEFYCNAKDSNFVPYIIDLHCDVETCLGRNSHQRSESDIRSVLDNWCTTPLHYIKLDISSLLENVVEMEDVENMATDDNANSENAGPEETITIVAEEEDSNSADATNDCGFLKSKWENDTTVENLARLDGTKRLMQKRKAASMADYLQLDEWEPPTGSANGKKRVRWADIEEKRTQQKMRAIGFVVGQTDWKRMMDPNAGNRALNKTKYIERVNKRR